jgi:hypothetical protein
MWPRDCFTASQALEYHIYNQQTQFSMKKIKWTILTFAILLSIGGAFASRPHALVSGLYWYNGTEYLAAGQLGVTYVCESSPNTCTYTYSGGVYTPYQTASSYTPIQITPPTKPSPKQGK